MNKQDYLEKSKEYYDKRFGDRSLQTKKLTEEEEFRLGKLRETLVDLRKNYQGSGTFRILDFGCGRGWLSNEMKSLGEVTGVDLSPEAISSATETYPGVRFISLDASSKDIDELEEGSFDLVFSSEVIEHVAEQLNYLQNAAKYLKKGGFFVITTPNGNWKEHFFFGERKDWGQPYEFWLKPQELAAMISSASLKVISLETFNSNWIFDMPSFGKPLTLGNPWLRKTLRLFGLKNKYLSWLEKKGYGLYLIATAKKN